MKTVIQVLENKTVSMRRPRAFVRLWARTLVQLTLGAWRSISTKPSIVRERGPGLRPEEEHEHKYVHMRSWL